jgi:hypothetical protein
MPAREELLRISQHCRVMSRTIQDVQAVEGFRSVAEQLEALAVKIDSVEERVRQLTKENPNAKGAD